MTMHPTQPPTTTRFTPAQIGAFGVMLAGVFVSLALWVWFGLVGLFVGLSVSVLAGAIAFAFVVWMGRDATRALKEVQAKHHHVEPEPNGDLSAVAGAPDLPPWMGVSR